MSLKIIKAGILDTVQDAGRYGFRHLGINPSGAMDVFSMQVANLLAGNEINEAAIELHFPASVFLFEQDTMIAISGADFSPALNGDEIPLHRSVMVTKNSVLQFREMKKGARCYLAVNNGLQIPYWLNSAATNLKLEAEGLTANVLKTNDNISFRKQQKWNVLPANNGMRILPWKADIHWDLFTEDNIYVLPGNELNRLDDFSKRLLVDGSFKITGLSDRMGYRLSGTALNTLQNEELISCAVNFGTIQLLPDGQLIILMADHQTTGGYPRIGYVISAHHSKLAQMQPGENIRFRFTDIKTAEELLSKQQQHLRQLQNACKFRLQEFLQ